MPSHTLVERNPIRARWVRWVSMFITGLPAALAVMLVPAMVMISGEADSGSKLFLLLAYLVGAGTVVTFTLSLIAAITAHLSLRKPDVVLG